jgi:hypothetical protein
MTRLALILSALWLACACEQPKSEPPSECVESVRLLDGSEWDFYRCYAPKRMLTEKIGDKVLVRCACPETVDGGHQ